MFAANWGIGLQEFTVGNRLTWWGQSMWFGIPLLHSFKYYVVMHICEFYLTAHAIINVGGRLSYGGISMALFVQALAPNL